MSATIETASRFSVLDDDVEPGKAKNQAKKPAVQPSNTNGKAQSSKNTKPKSKPVVLNSNLPVPPVKKAKSKKAQEATSEQWEEWKEHDQKSANKQYQKDLAAALIMDKEESKKPKPKKKQKEVAAIPLENFLDAGGKPSPPTNGQNTVDAATLREIEKGVQNIFRSENKKGKQPISDQEVNVRLLESQEVLTKKDEEIQRLNDELSKSKEELLAVKHRNKMLCGILASGEMKEKAQILIEVDKLTKEKDFLTGQVVQLTTVVEQERSKVHTLQNEIKKGPSAAARKRNDSVK